MKLVFILLLNQLLSTSSILHEKATVPVVFGASEEEDELLFGGRSLMVNPPRPVEDGLIIRIVGRDSSGSNVSPFLSEDEAYRRAFAATNSAAEQFSACSGGDFSFVPFRHSALERDGIITVHVNDAPYETYSKRTIREAADLKVCEHFGLPNGCSVGTHHKMFIMAAGLVDGHDNGFLSGAVGGDYSIFGDSPRYGVSSFDTEGILHEVAHNFRIGHAYHEGNAYGDDSGPMGGSYYLWGARNGNKRCFNGYNVWALQWQSNRVIEVPTGESGTATINGFADIDQLGPSDYLTIKYGDFFLMYNRQTGSNSATKEYADMVLIHERRPRSAGSNYFDSHLVGILEPNAQTTLAGVTFIVCENGSQWPKTNINVAVGVGASCSDGPISRFYADFTTTSATTSTTTTTEPTTTTSTTTTTPSTNPQNIIDTCTSCGSGRVRLCIRRPDRELSRCVTESRAGALLRTFPNSTCGPCGATFSQSNVSVSETTSAATTSTLPATTTTTSTTTTTTTTTMEPEQNGSGGVDSCDPCGGDKVRICRRRGNQATSLCTAKNRAEQIFTRFPASTCGLCSAPPAQDNSVSFQAAAAVTNPTSPATTTTTTATSDGADSCETCGAGKVRMCKRAGTRETTRCVATQRAHTLFRQFPRSTCGTC